MTDKPNKIIKGWHCSFVPPSGVYRISAVCPEPPEFEFDRIEEYEYNTETGKRTLKLTRWRSTKGRIA